MANPTGITGVYYFPSILLLFFVSHKYTKNESVNYDTKVNV